MKWIGQHIYDLIARFRDDVYLEDISDGTVDSSKFLGLDSNGKVVKQAIVTSVTDLHDAGVDGSNNQLLTDDGDGTITSEPNLTFNGSTLGLTGGTTTNIIDINAQALTTGNAIHVDCNALESGGYALFVSVDDAQTTTNVKNLSQINYGKSGVTGSGQGHYVSAHAVIMNDAATNNTGGFVQHKAYNSLMSVASGDGNISQISFKSDITGGDDAYYAYGGNTSYRGNVGFFSDSSGSDFIAVSPLDHGDYFEIATTTHGATKLKTVDDDAVSAHLELEADGNITLDAAGDIALEAGDLTMYDAVNDGSPTISIGSSATERLEIKALYASGTQEVSQAVLTTYTDSSTGNRGRFVFKVDEVTKAQIWDAGLNLSAASKLQIDGTDIIGDSSGAVKLSNIGLLDATTEATIEAAMDTLPNVTSLGTLTNLDVDDINLNTKTITITGDTDDTFSVVTGAAGATTLTTVDTAGANGHLAMVADGDITLDSAGKIDLEIADGDYIDMYNTTNRFASFYAESGASSSLTMYEMGGDSYDDWFHLNVGEHGATKLSTGDDDGAQAHIEIEADGNIILDAEGDIALEVTGGDVTGDADNYTFTSSSSGKPLLTLKTTNTTKETSGELRFQKDANNTQDSEIIGQVSFYGENNAGTPETLQYGRILGYMADQIDGQEAGGLQISVAAYDGVLTSGLLLNGNTNVDDQVDVTIGSGSGSKTAIAGTIELGHASDTTIARAAAGVVTIQGDQIITSKPTTVSSGQHGQLGMQIARRTITQAEMNDLHNTPIAIVPALGANLVAIPVNGTIFVDRAANQTNSAQLVIGYGSSTWANSIYLFKRFHYNISTDFHYGLDMYVGNFGTSMTAGVNTAINASADVAYTNNAFTSVDVYINYYVIDRS